MDIKFLYYFKRVAEVQHITQAAKDLYVSQAYLSRVIARVEQEVGVPLFDREGRGIVLNESGRLYYDYVLKMISIYQEATVKAREAAYHAQFQLCLATNVGAYTPQFITQLSKENPGLRIRQNSAPRKSILSMLRNGTATFAITCPPLSEMGIETIALFEEVPVVVFPEGHWLAQRGDQPVSLKELEGELFVGVSRGYGARDGMEILYQKHSFNPVFAVETGESTAQVLDYVKEGLGIALCPKSLVVRDAAFSNRYRDLAEDTTCTVGLSWSSERAFSPYDSAFKDAACSYFKRFDHIEADCDPAR